MVCFVKTNHFERENMSASKYRVVCTDIEGKTCVDFYPAGYGRPENCITHDGILLMRQLANPKATLVDKAILTELGNEQIHIQFEDVPKSMRKYHELARQKLAPFISRNFKRMKQNNADRTIEISFSQMAVLYDLNSLDIKDNKPHSAREHELSEQYNRQKKLEQKRHDRHEFYAHQPHAAKPEILLAWKQAQFRGD